MTKAEAHSFHGKANLAQVRKPSIWQESKNPDGSVSSAFDISRIFRYASEEATSAWVCRSRQESCGVLLTECRFMSDKIMPLSEAVEGYDLFDKMKVQKGQIATRAWTAHASC